MTSPHLRSFGPASVTDVIRAFRYDFLRGISDLPILSGQDWQGKREIPRMAYAEAALWCHFFGRTIPELPDEAAVYCPFGAGTPELKTLLQWPGAAALYPTCGEQTVHLRHLYLFRCPGSGNWPDHKRYLCFNAMVEQGILVYITDDFAPITHNQDGDSWQLAFAMARRALDGQPEAREKLATKYLLTGAVRSGIVESVKIEGKTSLLDQYGYEGLTFLVPEKNKTDLNDLPENRYHTVSNTDQAWRLISGSGFEKNEIKLPDPVKELHILVGGSAKPVLAVILLLNPEKVCLWCSEATSQQADSILSVLRQSRLKSKLGKKYLDSHDLQQAYSDLDQALKSVDEKAGMVVGTTGGNRLMGFAALLIAQTYGIPAVYRDIDAGRDCLTGIQFRNGQRLTSDLRINRCPFGDSVNWDWLYSKEPQSEDLFRQLFPHG